MKPEKFPGHNKTLNANNEDGWAPLPVYFGRINGHRGFTSFWSMSDEELAWITKNRGIFIHIVGGQQPPLELLAQDLDFPHDSHLHWIYYESNILPVQSAWVLMVADTEVPEMISLEGRQLELSNKYNPKPCEWLDVPGGKKPVVHVGSLYLRDATVQDAEARFQEIKDKIPALSKQLEQDLITTEANVRRNSLRLPVLVRMLAGGKEEVIG